MVWQIFVLNGLELSAAITGFIVWNKIQNSFWKYFPIYLLVIFLIEVFAEYILHATHNLPFNVSIYRWVGIPIQFFFLFWIFHQHFKSTNPTHIPMYAAVIYIISWLVDLGLINVEVKLWFDSLSYTIGCILLLICVLIYFYRFIGSDDVLDFKSSAMFWVSVGIIIFYLGTLPFWGLRTSLYRHYRSAFNVYWQIQFIFDVPCPAEFVNPGGILLRLH